MSALTPEMIRLIEAHPLGFVATVSVGGRPNVSPKGTFVVLDERTVAFGEIRSPRTLTNLQTRPELEVNFIDPFTRKGVRLRGTARLVRRGTEPFTELLPRWEALWGALARRINALALIDVEHASPLASPIYDDGAQEAEVVAQWRARFSALHPET